MTTGLPGTPELSSEEPATVGPPHHPGSGNSDTAALIAHGNLEAQQRMHTRCALDHGATPAELDALATLLAIYTGFARAAHSP